MLLLHSTDLDSHAVKCIIHNMYTNVLIATSHICVGDKAINDKHTFLFVMPIMEYSKLIVV